MSGSNEGLFTWLFVAALLFSIGLPSALVAYQKLEQVNRRRLERSRRRIKIDAEAPAAAATGCPHKRSRSRARAGSDGKMRSVCRYCGEAMIRRGPGDWEPVTPAPSGGQSATGDHPTGVSSLS